MPEYKIEFKDMAWELPMEGINFKAFNDNKKKLRLVEYHRHMEPHWCSKGHMGYVLEGQMEIEFDRDKILLNPGDGLHIPNGDESRHMARVISDKAVFIMVEDI